MPLSDFRASARPLGDRIRRHLREEMEAGRLLPGDRVPSERELTAFFRVSRMTARQALKDLEHQGLLTRVQGRGTFVSAPKLEQPLMVMTSFTEHVRGHGLRPGSRVLSAEVVPAGREAALALGLPERAPLLKLARLRLVGEDPVVVEVTHLSADRFPDLMEHLGPAGSLYQVLQQRYGVQPAHARQTLEAGLAGPAEAPLLHVGEGAPVLLLERTTFDRQGKPIEYVRSCYRGDRYRFLVELRPGELAAGSADPIQ